MKNAFWRPLTMRWNVFWVTKNQISTLKMGQNIPIWLQSGPRGLTPHPFTVNLTIKRPVFWTNPPAEILFYNSNLQKGGREPKCIGFVWNPCRAESLLDGGWRSQLADNRQQRKMKLEEYQILTSDHLHVYLLCAINPSNLMPQSDNSGWCNL